MIQDNSDRAAKMEAFDHEAESPRPGWKEIGEPGSGKWVRAQGAKVATVSQIFGMWYFRVGELRGHSSRMGWAMDGADEVAGFEIEH